MDSESNSQAVDSSIHSDSTTTQSLPPNRGKSTLLTWDYTRLPLPNEPYFKGRARLIYYKYYASNSSYGTSVITNFRRYLKI